MAPAPALSTADTPPVESTEGSLPTLVAAAFDALARSGVAWALLRGEDDLATRGADIDLLVEAARQDAAVGALSAAGFVELGARGRGSHRFLFGYDPAEDRWVKLDLVTELAFGRYGQLATDFAPGCLARRESDRRPVRLTADDTFWTTLLHALLDRPRLRPDDPPTIARAASGAAPDGPMASALRAVLPAAWSPERVVQTARGADPAGLARLRRSLRSGLVRSDPGRFAGRLALSWAGRAAARLPGLGRGAGLSVAILGPDGAGKSTIAGGLVGAFPVPVRRVYLGLYGRGADGGGRGPSSRFGLPGRLAWLWRRSLAARWQQLRGRLVIFDRHVLDESLAGPLGGRRSRLRRWLLVHACPTPDLTIVLDVPGDELFQRKGEHDPAFLERQRVRYRALAERLRGGSVVDATVDAETVRRRVVALVWAAYGRRTAEPTVAESPPDVLDIPLGPADGIPPRRPKAHAETTRQIRGSSLLLGGRALSMGVNFVVQVLIVRYLTQSDYGAFAYALSLVTLAQTVITFGLDRGASRFLSIYDEQGDTDRLMGTIAFVGGTIVALGALVIVGTYLFQGLLVGSIATAEAVPLLLILILLAPIQALDELLTGLLSVFASPRAIFFRKFVIAPGLRLLVVLLLVASKAGVDFLAAGYVAAAAFGIVLYLFILWQVLERRGTLARMRTATLRIPAKEILLFTIPLLTTDLVYVALNTSDAILLEHFKGVDAVAAWRAIQPAAGLNQLVMQSFTLLFTPVAARLYARKDREGVSDLYWRTAIWMAVISYPLFALTFCLADPVTAVLYGPRYEASATYLALLSFGYYFNTALGFNGLTLRIYGIIKYIVAINVAAAVINVALNLVLIPRFGALGAAVGTTLTLVAHNILKQAGLRLGTGISIFEWSNLRVYLIIAATSLGLIFVSKVLEPPAIVQLVLAGICSVIVLGMNRRALRLAETFPELRRLPFARFLFGG